MNALAPLSAPVPWSNCLRYTGLCEIHGALIFLSSLSLLITLLCGLGLGGLLTIYISLLELNIILSRKRRRVEKFRSHDEWEKSGFESNSKRGSTADLLAGKGN